MGDRPTPAEMAHAEAAAALTDLNIGIVRAAFPPGSAHEELFDLLVADRAALLDMVDGLKQREEGWKQLVEDLEGMALRWKNLPVPRETHPRLSGKRAGFAAASRFLSDTLRSHLALTPQGDEEA